MENESPAMRLFQLRAQYELLLCGVRVTCRSRIFSTIGTSARLAMQSLRHTFALLQCIGLWRPLHWSPGWKTELYYFYTCFTMFLLVTVTLSELIELLRSMDDVNALANNSFMLLTMIGVCGKAANILSKRDGIIDLTSVLQSDPCRPKTEEEFVIQMKFDRWARSNILRYGTLVGATITALTLKSLLDDVPRRTLPFNSWLPFDYYDSLLDYSIAYGHQIVTLATGAAVHVTFDTLVSGLMLQTCAQLNILKHRFLELPQIVLDSNHRVKAYDESNVFVPNVESELLSQQIKHHLEIFKFAKTTNNLFGPVIFLQFTISTLVLCVSIFEISTMEVFTVQFASQLLYLGSMLTQIFIFCFYGCEVTFESIDLSDAIYEMDWTTLSLYSKRSLVLVMVRSSRPIEYTSGRLITANLESFNSLLKLSYSAYNVMQRTSAE